MDTPKDRAAMLLKSMTLAEKVAILGGKNMWETQDIPRLGIRSLKTTDGPAGVRGAKWTNGTSSTYIPCGISLAATFDSDLIRRVGQILGAETKAKGAKVLLAPTMNMSRSPFGGRNFENFGEDPFLTGTMATSIVEGIQSQGVGACLKHYVGNEQEGRRFNIDEQISERTLREVYLRPFKMAMAAEPWSVMTSYNKVNGEHVDASKRLVDTILRDEWRFDGIVMSDWGGLNDTVQSVLAGTDLEMPGPPIRRGKKLMDAVEAGQITEDELNPCVERMLRFLEMAGCIEHKESSLDSNEVSALADSGYLSTAEENVDRPEFRQLARQAAADAIVLLKNDDILPLKTSSIRKLAIIGPNAATPTIGGAGSASVNPYYISTPYESIKAVIEAEEPSVKVQFARGILTHKMLPLAGKELTTPDGKSKGLQMDFYAGHSWQGDVVGSAIWETTQIMLMSDGDQPAPLRGKDYCFRASGVYQPEVTGTYLVGISSTGKSKLYINDKLVLDNSNWSRLGEGFMNCGSEEIRANIDLVAGESYHIHIDQIAVPPPIKPHDNTLFHTVSGIRFGVLPPIDEEALFQDAIKAAAEADTVVLVVGHNNGTEREGSDRVSLDLPGRTAELVRAVSAANKRAIVVNQSACTVDLHSWRNDPAAILQAWYQGQETGNAIADVLFGRVNPSGKLPLTFPKQIGDHGSHKWFPGDLEHDYAEYGEETLIGYRWFDKHDIEPAWAFGYGGSYTSFTLSNARVDGVIDASGTQKATVSVDVKNTGDLAGAEVVQVYCAPSPQIEGLGLEAAPQVLAGFGKVLVEVGQMMTASIELDRTAFEWFNPSNNAYQLDSGEYKVYVGTSSRSIAATLLVNVI